MGLSDIETIPETGAVFTIGRSRFADNIASHFFIRKDPVVSITCGDEHSAVICQSGRLFVFGSNDWGQLGLGHKNHVSKPSCVKVLKPEKVTHVACGRAHTLICTGDQKIFACGSDQEGQLGRGSSGVGDSASSPVLVYDCGLAGPKILQLQAGSHHSLALTSDGGVIAWGSNLEGQLGLSGISGLVNQPTKVQIPEPVKQISAGYYHSAFLTESGLIYVCGESESGKLGIEVSFSTQVAPKQMQLPCPAVHVACGGHHTLILADTGNLYCVGSNASGQLGMGTTVTELQTPKLLPRGALQDETITEIACGESHSAVLTDSGKLFTCGDGRHGKLGLEENENNVHELTVAPKYLELFVTNVACGGCHTILVAQRRDMGISRETESMQTDHVQKRTALPPLKVPLNRLPTENHEDKIKEKEVAEVDQENNLEQSTATMVTMTAVTMVTTNPETTDTQENVVENFEKIKVDSGNDIEKLGSPKESLVDVPKEILSKSNEAEESIKEDTTAKQKNDNENNEIKVDKENNVEEEIKTESTTEEKNDTKNNVENSSDNNNESNKEESTKEDCTKSVKGNNNGDASDTIIEDKQTNNNSEAKMSPEKHVSSSSGTPPPKPPRLKSESSNSLSTERISSGDKEKEKIANKENDDITSNEENSSEKSQANLKHGLASKHESATTKSSAKGGSSTSRNSKADTEEITEIRKAIDEVDEKGKPHEQKMDNENTVDDADVVQSPAPRTGKMSKIFKSKKQQEIENGTKAASTVSHKAKSKTCTIL